MWVPFSLLPFSPESEVLGGFLPYVAYETVSNVRKHSFKTIAPSARRQHYHCAPPAASSHFIPKKKFTKKNSNLVLATPLAHRTVIFFQKSLRLYCLVSGFGRGRLVRKGVFSFLPILWLRSPLFSPESSLAWLGVWSSQSPAAPDAEEPGVGDGGRGCQPSGRRPGSGLLSMSDTQSGYLPLSPFLSGLPSWTWLLGS